MRNIVWVCVCLCVLSDYCVCLCACVERLASVWRDWIVFRGESCVYVSIGGMWDVEGETQLYGGMFV